MDASLIKKLKDMTNAGLMDCKKALEENNEIIDEAVKKAEQLNIYYERRSERNITIFVTADEFSTLNIGDVTMYGLASEFEEEGKGMDL